MIVVLGSGYLQTLDDTRNDLCPNPLFQLWISIQGRRPYLPQSGRGGVRERGADEYVEREGSGGWAGASEVESDAEWERVGGFGR